MTIFFCILYTYLLILRLTIQKNGNILSSSKEFEFKQFCVFSNKLLLLKFDFFSDDF